MARKRKKAPAAELDINLTPMIDVVFNLIIFFMVITDLTQKDLEYLVLPRADQAAEDPGDDPDRLIVNIINFDSKNNQARIAQGDLNPNLPPILMGGKQFENLDVFREQLRIRANPKLYPDKEKAPVAPGLYPSKKPLLLRCDQGQIFGWVQAVMQYCTFVPGRDPTQELQNSPLIYKLEIAVAEKETN